MYWDTEWDTGFIMSYKTFISIKLKNINEKKVGCINLEITFTHKINKKKIRRYVNTNQYINENDFGKYGIKTNRDELKSIKFLVDKRKQETAELLRKLEIEHDSISPEIYDNAVKASEDSKKDIFEEILSDVAVIRDELIVNSTRSVTEIITENQALNETLQKMIATHNHRDDWDG